MLALTLLYPIWILDAEIGLILIISNIIAALSGNASKLLLAAKKVRRATKTQFLISFTADDFSQANDNYAGKLRLWPKLLLSLSVP